MLVANFKANFPSSSSRSIWPSSFSSVSWMWNESSHIRRQRRSWSSRWWATFCRSLTLPPTGSHDILAFQIHPHLPFLSLNTNLRAVFRHPFDSVNGIERYTFLVFLSSKCFCKTDLLGSGINSTGSLDNRITVQYSGAASAPGGLLMTHASACCETFVAVAFKL